MVISLVPREVIHDIWDKVKDLIGKTDDQFLQKEDILRHLTQGDWRLWVAIEENTAVAAMTVQFVYYPRDKVCRIVTIGGDRLYEWFTPENQEQLESWARSEGCSHIDLFGRKGWRKVLRDFEEVEILMRKKI